MKVDAVDLVTKAWPWVMAVAGAGLFMVTAYTTIMANDAAHSAKIATLEARIVDIVHKQQATETILARLEERITSIRERASFKGPQR